MPIDTAAGGRHSASAPSAGRTARFRLTLLPRPELTEPDDGTRAERHRRTVLIGDAAAALLTGLALTALTGAGAPARHPAPPSVVWTLAAMALPAIWLGLLALRGCYRADAIAGSNRSRGVAMAAGVLVAALSAGAYLLAAPLPRTVPLATAIGLLSGSVLVRWAARARLHQERSRGRGLSRVLVVGHPESAAALIEALDAAPQCGLVAVGACLPYDGSAGTPTYGVPITADVSEVLAMADELAVTAVALSSDLDLSGLAGRRLLEALTERGTALLAVPGIDTAIWAPRASPVAGAPLHRLGRRPVG